MVGRILTKALHGAAVLLFYLGAAPIVRWLGRKTPKVLLYHDCADAESDYTAGLECTTSPNRFAEHLAYLKKHYAIVDVQRILEGSAPERAVALTFDDGYASVHRNAFPHLKASNAPAVVYLISSVVDNRALVWVNELNYFLRTDSQAPEFVARHFQIPENADPDQILTFCRLNYRPEKMAALLSELRSKDQRPAIEHALEAQLYLTWDEIREMRSAGIEFGNHSRTHANLECLTEEEQAEEIEGAQRDLESHLGRVRAFAHPFGHHGPTTAQIASRATIESVANVGGHNSPIEPFALGRTHMADEDIAGLFARMEVVEPIKGLIRRTLSRGKTAMTKPRTATPER